MRVEVRENIPLPSISVYLDGKERLKKSYSCYSEKCSSQIPAIPTAKVSIKHIASKWRDTKPNDTGRYCTKVNHNGSAIEGKQKLLWTLEMGRTNRDYSNQLIEKTKNL